VQDEPKTDSRIGGGTTKPKVHMKKLVQMEKLALRIQPWSREDHWGLKFFRHLMRASSAQGFINDATRANTVAKLLHHPRIKGSW
jgi:hypothetical protein